jgi:hypothetical protein
LKRTRERTARIERLSELRKQAQKLGNEIARLETITEREDAEPWIGKCFKYLNRQSDGSSWWLYIRVTAHDHGNCFKILQCQSQSGGWHIVTTNDHVYLLPHPKERGYVQITRRQFDAAWRKHVERIAALNSSDR